jgi:hypothetical protein
MSEETKPGPKQDDLTEATEAASIELEEADLERASAGISLNFTKIKTVG